MALPSLRAAGTVVHSSASSFTVLLPVSAVAGDLAICWLSSNNSDSDYVRWGDLWRVARGTRTWARVAQSGGTRRIAAFMIVLNAADISAGTVTVTNLTGSSGLPVPTAAVVVAYQDGVGVEASAGSSSYNSVFRSYQAPTINLSNPESLVIEGWVVSGSAAPSSVPATLEVASSSASTSFAISEQAQPAAGTSVPESAAMASTSVYWSAITLSVYGYGPPLAPTLSDPPSNTYRDLASGYTFTWVFNSASVPATTQTAYALRRKTGVGSYEYWNAGLAAWQGTIAWNTSSTSSVVFPAGKWTNGTPYQWSVATQDSIGQGPFAADFIINASDPPSVVVTAPSGTAASSSPNVTWTPTTSIGTTQSTYRVVVETGIYSTTPGSGTLEYDSGVVSSGATSNTIGVVLPTGAAFRAFVQITETGGQVSAWAYSTFNTVFTLPPTPTVGATWDAINARAVITISGTDPYILEVSEDVGVTWQPVRGTGSGSPVYDYERTPGAVAIYQARATEGSGDTYVVSPWSSSSAPIYTEQTSWWIKDVLEPALNMALCDAQQNVRVQQGDSVAVYPAGRVNPVVLRGAVHGVNGNFRTIVKTEADRTDALALFTVQDPILIQDPRGRQWYAEWVGDLSESPYQFTSPYYALQRNWVEVDVPS